MNAKVIVITGASGGIGAALATQLGTQGHSLALAAQREPELNEVAAKFGERAVAVVCDVRRRSDVERLEAVALDRFGRIDVWINNAGRGIGKRVLELTDDDFDEMINVNLKSAWYGMQAIIPYFQQQRKGHLINVSTFLSRVPFVTHRSVYSAAKAALNILTANLRMDLRADYPDIHVSLVMPGVVTTDFARNALGGTPPFSGVAVQMKPQSAEEVGRVIATLIENPQPEVYTNPALVEIARSYYGDVGAFEAKLPQRK